MEISRSIFLSSRDNTRIAGEIRGDTGKIVDKLLTIYTARSRFDGRSKIIGKHGVTASFKERKIVEYVFVHISSSTSSHCIRVPRGNITPVKRNFNLWWMKLRTIGTDEKYGSFTRMKRSFRSIYIYTMYFTMYFVLINSLTNVRTFHLSKEWEFDEEGIE